MAHEAEDRVKREIVKRSSLEEAARKDYDVTYVANSNLTAGGSFQAYDENAIRIHYVPSTLKSTLGSPTALAIGAFSTTLTTLSLSLMEFRGVTVTSGYIGNFFFLAGVGMVISAQWELILGNSFGYTALSAFGFFYAAFGAILTPFFGVTAAYGGSDTPEYNNALGFFVLMWTVLNTFFFVGSLSINVAYAWIFGTVELAFGLIAASYLAYGDGNVTAGDNLKKAGGAFAFLAGLGGWYVMGHLMCQTSTFWHWPLGDTSRFFVRKSKKQ